MNERADENPNPLDGLEAHEAVQLILHHLQAALPPLLTAWLLYSLRLGSAPGEHGWAVHTVWKRRLVGVGSVEN